MADREPIRVVVADDQAIVRRELVASMMAYPDLRLVGEAKDGEEAIELCELTQPDVVLMDLDMPRVDGYAATRIIHRRWSHIRVFALIDAEKEEMVQRALEAGATACLDRGISSAELVQSILRFYERRQEVAQIGGAEHTQAELVEVLSPSIEPLHEHSHEEMENRTTQELEMAWRIQSGILPAGAPSIRGWNVAARLVPARETSGDFFDFIPLRNDKWAFLIADVTDKGLGAAVFMALCSSLIRTYAARYPTLPAIAMGAVNERILTDTRGSLFVTAFYAILEPELGRMRYVNAGHNPPFLLSSLKSKRVDRLNRTGIPLGISQDATWGQKIVKFSPGDTLVLFTDGITEAQNRQGAFFGDQRLLDVIRANVGQPAAHILQAVLDRVQSFIGGTPQEDDIALIILSRQR